MRYIKNFSLIVSVVMMCSLLGGCGSQQKEEQVNYEVSRKRDITQDEDKTQALKHKDKEMIIVTDSYGREVEVPTNIERIILMMTVY